MTLWSGRVGSSLDPAVWEFLHAADAELLPYDCEATSRTRSACTAPGCSATTS